MNKGSSKWGLYIIDEQKILVDKKKLDSKEINKWRGQGFLNQAKVELIDLIQAQLDLPIK